MFGKSVLAIRLNIGQFNVGDKNSIIVRWLSEIIVTEWIKSPNFAGGFFSTY